jgi:Zn-dependent peptidase ImmA (M78 family)
MLAKGFKARAENISLQVRRELKLSKTDPLACEALAEHLGVPLWKPTEIVGLSPGVRALLLRRARDSWSAVTVSYGGLDVIIYNSSHSKARRSSDVMHELSHILLSHEPSKIILSPKVSIALRDYNENQEDEAAWLAGCLLLPREALLFIRRNGMNDEETLEKYRVSRDLLKYRMNVTGVNYQAGRERR